VLRRPLRRATTGAAPPAGRSPRPRGREVTSAERFSLTDHRNILKGCHRPAIGVAPSRRHTHALAHTPALLSAPARFEPESFAGRRLRANAGLARAAGAGKIGSSRPTVVDHRLQARTAGLGVVDASIMPAITRQCPDTISRRYRTPVEKVPDTFSATFLPEYGSESAFAYLNTSPVAAFR